MWTAPRTYTVNEVLTASIFNTDHRDNLILLGAGARVTHSANWAHTSISNWLAHPFDTERYDPSGFHSNVTNNSRLTVPSGLGGRYLLWASIEWAANAGGIRQMRFRVNGTTVIALSGGLNYGGGSPPNSPDTFSTVWFLNAGDYVEFEVYQSATASLDSVKVASYAPEFAIQGLGGTT